MTHETWRKNWIWRKTRARSTFHDKYNEYASSTRIELAVIVQDPSSGSGIRPRESSWLHCIFGCLRLVTPPIRLNPSPAEEFWDGIPPLLYRGITGCSFSDCSETMGIWNRVDKCWNWLALFVSNLIGLILMPFCRQVWEINMPHLSQVVRITTEKVACKVIENLYLRA